MKIGARVYLSHTLNFLKLSKHLSSFVPFFFHTIRKQSKSIMGKQKCVFATPRMHPGPCVQIYQKVKTWQSDGGEGNATDC